MTKICLSCEQEKDIEEFSTKNNKGRRQPRCKLCRARLARIKYDPVYQAKRSAFRRAENKRILHEAKDNPCLRCKQKYPYYVMEFHHRGEKIDAVGRMVYTATPNNLRKEIKKCDLLCANCHRIITYEVDEPGQVGTSSPKSI